MRIVYLDIDCLRPDHLGCNGYGRPTSPAIDSLAARGTVFTGCHVSDAPCLPSRAALSSGRFGIANGVTCHNGPASQLRYPGNGHRHDPDHPQWMRVLQQAGYDTVCFSGFAQRHMAWWFHAGFTHDFGNRLAGGSESADDVNAAVLPWLRGHGADEDWFLHVTYYDAHTPYRAPRRYLDQVRRAGPPPWPDAAQVERDAHAYYGPRTARDWWHDQPGWQRPDVPLTRSMPDGNPETYDTYRGFLDGYDAGIAHIDDRIGDLLAELERLGIRDETAVIVSADHGESIGELGMYFEHGNACEGTTRVPLIVDWPGLPGGGRHEGLAYQLDLPPTVLELLGLPVPPGWDGRPLTAALCGEQASGRDHLVLGCGIYSYQRAVRTDRYRLIRTLHPGLYPYDPVYLFDMHADPHQRHDIAAERPDVLARLDHLLLEWTLHHTTGPAAAPDPFALQLAAGAGPDLYCPRAKMEQRLTDLGRDDQLADLRCRRDIPAPLRLEDAPRA